MLRLKTCQTFKVVTVLRACLRNSYNKKVCVHWDILSKLKWEDDLIFEIKLLKNIFLLLIGKCFSFPFWHFNKDASIFKMKLMGIMVVSIKHEVLLKHEVNLMRNFYENYIVVLLKAIYILEEIFWTFKSWFIQNLSIQI